MSSAYVRANRTIYTNFVGFLTKKGNKVAAKRMVDEAFHKAAKATNLPAQVVLTETFAKLNSLVEIKRVRIGQQTHVVPFSINFKRRTYLVVKWLMEAVDQDKRKVGTADKLAMELTNTVKNKTSKSIQTKEMNTEQALMNRANIHYRW